MSSNQNWYRGARCNCSGNELHYTLERHGKEFESMDIRELVKEYVLECELRRYSKRTVVGRRNRLNQFADWCDENGIKGIDEISLAIVKRYAKHQTDKGLKGSTVNCYLKTVKFLCQYAYESGYATFNTKNNWFYVKEQKPVIKVFEDDDVKQLIKNCNDGRTAPAHKFKSHRDKTILYTFIETGIRCMELTDIRLKDVNLEQGYITIKGKGNRIRLVAITKPLAKQLMIYMRERDKFFPDTKEEWLFLSVYGKKLDDGSVADIFRRRGKGIKTEARMSPHTCRHYWTKTSVKNGMSIVVIQRQLGHVNLSITENYLASLTSMDIINIAKEASVLMSIR